MSKMLILFIVGLFLISSCNQKLPQNTECKTENDCAIGGCSNQICGQKDKIKDTITTCEYKEEYKCLKETSCLCINNKCQFEENKNYLSCLENIKR